MKTTAVVECDDRTKICKVGQNEFPGVIDLQCHSSECVSELRGYKIPNESFLYLFVSGGVGAGLFILLIVLLLFTTIFDLIYTNKAKKEWKSL
jgi:uncharacterized membrane protein